MLWPTSDLIRYRIRATDGSIGTIRDLLFEDHTWAVRWFVADTGSWLPGRKVLLPPSCCGHPNGELEELPVDLTRQQIEDSPDRSSDEPVSRQLEGEIYSHYGWVPYWAALPGAAAVPPVAPTLPPRAEEPPGDPHLRSAREVVGYHIEAADGEIGHVEEFLVDGDDWTVRYLVVDTRNWWPGKKVLVSPQWIESIGRQDRQVHVELTREAIKSSPELSPDTVVSRDYEELLYRHYQKPYYWA